MNKPLKYILFVFGCIAILWTVCRITNALQLFSIPTISNYPTLKPGDKILASSLVKPKRFDLICYYAEVPEQGRQIWIHRLCGIGGDKIEIRDGVLFVNDQNADNNLLLSHSYILSTDELEKARKLDKIDDKYIEPTLSDSQATFLSDKLIQEHSIKARRQTLPRDFIDETITRIYSHEWNQDHFGPIIVPKDKFFVLGDNRLYSMDSRFLGFIDKKDYVATMLKTK
ncbi:MAG: signal peptidase I [Chitinophagaceae bacterium]